MVSLLLLCFGDHSVIIKLLLFFSMKTFQSKSSFEVKMITIAIIAVMGLLSFSVIVIKENPLTIIELSVGLLVAMVLFYFYAISLDKVVVNEHQIKLKKMIGNESISFSDVRKVERLAFSNLTMTIGSKGFFGYRGSTMDDSRLMVKDRSKMIRIYTVDKHYTISCEDPDTLVSEIKDRVNQVRASNNQSV